MLEKSRLQKQDAKEIKQSPKLEKSKNKATKNTPQTVEQEITIPEQPTYKGTLIAIPKGTELEAV